MAEYHVEDKHVISLNYIIEQEASSLSNLHRRISLCVPIKFEKQLVVATNLWRKGEARGILGGTHSLEKKKTR